MNHVLPVVTLAVLLALSGPTGARPGGLQQATPPAPLPNRVYVPWAGQALAPTLTWRPRAPLLATRTDLGVAATAAGKVYVVGGRHYEGLLGPVEVYDPATDVWTARAPIPTPRSSLGVALGADGRIYAVGGLAGFPDRSIVATVEAYNPAADAWVARAPMPTARYSLGLAAARNGRLYAIGGYRGLNEVDPTGAVEEYDPATDAWRARAPMPTPRAGLALATGADGRIYAVGGADFSLWQHPVLFATVEAYDPATDTWARRADLPAARAELALVAAPNGRLYAIGGSDAPSTWLATVHEHNPATNTWRAVTPLGTARRGLAAVLATNGRIYAVGGRYFAPRGELNVVEEGTVYVAP